MPLSDSLSTLLQIHTHILRHSHSTNRDYIFSGTPTVLSPVATRLTLMTLTYFAWMWRRNLAVVDAEQDGSHLLDTQDLSIDYEGHRICVIPCLLDDLPAIDIIVFVAANGTGYLRAIISLTLRITPHCHGYCGFSIPWEGICDSDGARWSDRRSRYSFHKQHSSCLGKGVGLTS